MKISYSILLRDFVEGRELVGDHVFHERDLNLNRHER
jgi:hypothetical protein